MKKKLALLLVASMTMATLFVGCGSSDDEKETTKAAADSNKETEAQSEEAAKPVELADVDCSAGFMVAKTDWITCKGDFEYEFTLKHEGFLADGADWENIIVEFSTEGVDETTNAQSHYYTVVCNGNAWNWNGAEVADAATNWLGTPANAVATDDAAVAVKDILSSCDATVVIKRAGNVLSINGTFTNGTNTATWTAEVEEAQLPETINFHLGGEDCKLTGISYVAK